MGVSLSRVLLVGPVALGCVLALAGDEFACPNDALPRCETAHDRLVQAQTAVQEAAHDKSLWTTASEALREGQSAFARGDYESAQRAADFAIQQARLGVAQRAYPTFPFPSH